MIKPLILSFQENKTEDTSYKFIPVFCFNLLNKFGVICLTTSTFRTDIPSSCVEVMMMALFQITSTYGYQWYVTFSVGERKRTSSADAAVSTMCYCRSE